MPKQIVIITPSPPSASLLEGMRSTSGAEGPPLVLRHYPSREELRKIRADQHETTAFLVDCADEQQAFRVLRDLGLTQTDVPSVVLNGPRKLSTLVRAKQHGVAAYLSDFHGAEDLHRLALYLNYDRDARREQHRGGRLVSFVPTQGGSGASTIASHVAAAIGDQRRRECLLVDFDLHTGTIGFQLGLQPKSSLISVMCQPELSEGTLREAVTSTEGVDVLVGTTGTDQPEPSVFQRTTEFVSLIQRAYPYSLVDLPPATLSSAVDVLQRSHLVYLVCTPEITSLHLALRKLSYLESSGVSSDRVRLLVNRASSWGGLDVAAIEKVVGKRIEWLIDNDYRAVRQSALEGGLVSPGSSLRQQFAHLGTELLEELDFVSGPSVQCDSKKGNGVNTRMFA